MSLITLEKKIASLPSQYLTEIEDFIDFIISKHSIDQDSNKITTSYFGALKHKISFISSDFDEPLDDFQEYM